MYSITLSVRKIGRCVGSVWIDPMSDWTFVLNQLISARPSVTPRLLLKASPLPFGTLSVIVGRTDGAPSFRWYAVPVLLDCDRMIASSYCTPLLPAERAPAPPDEPETVA